MFAFATRSKDSAVEREVRGVTLDERQLGRELPGLRQHRWSDVDANDVGRREAIREHASARARAGADIEGALDRAGDAVECRLVRRERVRLPEGVPDRRDPIELGPDDRAKDRPETRPAHDHVRRQPGEPPSDQSEETRSRTSVPARTPNVSAALPREIASAMFR